MFCLPLFLNIDKLYLLKGILFIDIIIHVFRVGLSILAFKICVILGMCMMRYLGIVKLFACFYL